MVWLWGPSPSRDGADRFGQGRIGPAAGHPFAQLCGRGVVRWQHAGSAAVRTFTFAGREGTSGPEETQNKAAALSKEISGGMLLAEVEYRKVGKPMNLRAHQAFIHCLLRDLFG